MDASDNNKYKYLFHAINYSQYTKEVNLYRLKACELKRKLHNIASFKHI